MSSLLIQVVATVVLTLSLLTNVIAETADGSATGTVRPPEHENAQSDEADIRVWINYIVPDTYVFIDKLLQFTVSVRNLGNSTAVDVSVGTDDLGAMHAVAGTITCSKGSGSAVSHSAHCNFGDLESGETQMLTFSSKAMIPGTYVVTFNGGSRLTPDPDRTNNKASEEIIIDAVEKKCCSCWEEENIAVSCHTLAKQYQCDSVRILDLGAVKREADLLCPKQHKNLDCTSHRYIVNQHGLPASYGGESGGVMDFKTFLQAAKQACTLDDYKDWCRPKYYYTGQFCFSAEAYVDLKRECESANLPARCTFEFNGSQNECFGDEATLLPYPISAPLSIEYSGGECKVKFPSCASVVGKMCAPDVTVLAGLKKMRADRAKCRNVEGEVKTVQCVWKKFSNSGVWAYE